MPRQLRLAMAYNKGTGYRSESKGRGEKRGEYALDPLAVSLLGSGQQSSNVSYVLLARGRRRDGLDEVRAHSAHGGSVHVAVRWLGFVVRRRCNLVSQRQEVKCTVSVVQIE